jgi:hypothetical protein
MLLVHFLILMMILIFLGILWQRFQDKHLPDSSEETYHALRQEMLTESSLAKSKKPILWIHVPYEYNARHWLNFGSRSSHDLNQPYLFLTVKSIIKNCRSSFKIVIIDDDSFRRLLPNWSIDLSRLSDPVLCRIRELGIAKLLYHYGGIHVPISFLCFRDLKPMLRRGKLFVGENVNRAISSSSSSQMEFSADVRFMGTPIKQDPELESFIEFMQRSISEDYTDQATFLGECDRWLNRRVQSEAVALISGREVGTKTMHDEAVRVDNLLSEEYIQFYADAYGIWIPADEILKRHKYEWFARLSPEQIMESRLILPKYILLASAPDSKLGVIEPLKNRPDWVGFWKVPAYPGLYGLKPNDLGNHVRRVPYTGEGM